MKLIFFHLSDKRLNEQTGSLMIKRWEVGNVFFPEVSFDFFLVFGLGAVHFAASFYGTIFSRIHPQKLRWLANPHFQ